MSIAGVAALIGIALAFHPVVAAAEITGGVQEAGRDRIETYSCGELLCGGPVVLEERRENVGFVPLVGALPGMWIGPGAGASRWVGKHRVGGTIHDSWMGRGYRFAVTLERGGSRAAVGYVGAPLLGEAVFWIRLE